MNTIDAMNACKRKLLLDLWDALPLHEATGDTAASLRAMLMLSEVGDEIKIRAASACKREEAQTVEPVAIVESWTNSSYSRNYKVNWLKNVPEGTKLFTHPAPPPSGERAALVDRLREAIAVAITMLYESHKADTIAEFSLEELTAISRLSESLGTKQVEKIYRYGMESLGMLAADAQDEWHRGRAAGIEECEKLNSELQKQAQQVAVPQATEYCTECRKCGAAELYRPKMGGFDIWCPNCHPALNDDPQPSQAERVPITQAAADVLTKAVKLWG